MGVGGYWCQRSDWRPNRIQDFCFVSQRMDRLWMDQRSQYSELQSDYCHSGVLFFSLFFFLFALLPNTFTKLFPENVLFFILTSLHLWFWLRNLISVPKQTILVVHFNFHEDFEMSHRTFFLVILIPRDLMIPRKSKRSYTVFRDDFNSFNKDSYTTEVSSWGGGVSFHKTTVAVTLSITYLHVSFLNAAQSLILKIF